MLEVASLSASAESTNASDKSYEPQLSFSLAITSYFPIVNCYLVISRCHGFGAIRSFSGLIELDATMHAGMYIKTQVEFHCTGLQIRYVTSYSAQVILSVLPLYSAFLD
jgi:hypothetical protein